MVEGENLNSSRPKFYASLLSHGDRILAQYSKVTDEDLWMAHTSNLTIGYDIALLP
jgi:hypothetical protein